MAARETVTVTRLTEVEIPNVPNFLRVVGVKDTQPVESFSDKELQAIGSRWVQRLVKHAQHRREHVEG